MNFPRSATGVQHHADNVALNRSLPDRVMRVEDLGHRQPAHRGHATIEIPKGLLALEVLWNMGMCM